MNKKKWFKISLWIWLGSIPFMLLMDILADWLQHVLQPDDTVAQINALMTAPTPWEIIAVREIAIFAGLYMILGWVPVAIFGFLKETKPKVAK